MPNEFILNPNDPRLKEPTGRLDVLLRNRSMFTPGELKGLGALRGVAANVFNTLRNRQQPFTIKDVRAQVMRYAENARKHSEAKWLQNRGWEHVKQADIFRAEAAEALYKMGDDQMARLMVALIPPPSFAVIAGIRRYFQHPAAGGAATAVIGVGIDPEAAAQVKEDLDAIAGGANAGGTGGASGGPVMSTGAAVGIGAGVLVILGLAVAAALLWGRRS